MSTGSRVFGFVVPARRLAVLAVLSSVVVGLGAGTAGAQSQAVYRWGSYKTVGQGAANDQHVPTAGAGADRCHGAGGGNSGQLCVAGQRPGVVLGEREFRPARQQQTSQQRGDAGPGPDSPRAP